MTTTTRSSALRIRDAVHGDIVFEGALGATMRELIDTPVFQRLRHIRQNGVTNLVFPGAEHSRFAHSLGVAATAQRMLDAIVRNSGVEISERERDATVLAALLHDVGHGPFSHTLEEILGAAGVQFKHDTLSEALIRANRAVGLSAILEAHSRGLATTVADYIAHKHKHWTVTLVSSQLDADRLDYVRRDAQLAGIHNARPDIERLIAHLHVHEGEVVVHRKAFDVVESFLLALDHLYERVYFHKAVRAAALLLGALLRRAARCPKAAFSGRSHPIRTLLTAGNKVELAEYINVSDTTVWGLVAGWRSRSDETLSYLAERLWRRELPKALGLPLHGKGDVIKLVDRARELVRAKFPNIDHEYLVYVDDAQRVNYMRYSPSGDESKKSIMIGDGSAKPKAIEDEQRSIVPTIIEKIYKSRLYVPAKILEPLRDFARREKIPVDL